MNAGVPMSSWPWLVSSLLIFLFGDLLYDVCDLENGFSFPISFRASSGRSYRKYFLIAELSEVEEA